VINDQALREVMQRSLDANIRYVCSVPTYVIPLLHIELHCPPPQNGPVEKWEGSDKNLRNWPKIKWLIYIINH